jgi:hypothetical protein
MLLGISNTATAGLKISALLLLLIEKKSVPLSDGIRAAERGFGPQ